MKAIYFIFLLLLAQGTTADSSPGQSGAAAKLWGDILPATREFLEPDRAFQFSSAVVDDGKALLARWEITDGYYLYRDKFRFRITSGSSGVELGAPHFPMGKMKDDEAFGRVEVYYNRVEIRIPINREAGATRLELKTGYQGCAENGICYSPMHKTIQLDLPEAVNDTAS